MTVKALIHEQGQGFPNVGQYVPGDDGNSYRVTAIPSPIPKVPGKISYAIATLERDDLGEHEKFPALAILAFD